LSIDASSMILFENAGDKEARREPLSLLAIDID
jgi:hypothetical protein